MIFAKCIFKTASNGASYLQALVVFSWVFEPVQVTGRVQLGMGHSSWMAGFHNGVLILISSPLSSSTCKLAATRPLPSNEGCGPPYIDVNGFQVGMVPCLGWGKLQSKRGDPWHGRPARYATRWTTVGLPLTYFPKTPQDKFSSLYSVS